MLALLGACESPADPARRAPDPATWTATPASGGWSRDPGEPIPLAPGLVDLPWLQEVSVFAAAWDTSESAAHSRSTSGAFGVGNGHVFGLAGLDTPWNTLTNLIGPGYQLQDGFFGDLSAHLLVGGAEVEASAEQVQRPRRTAIARTRLAAAEGGMSLVTTDVAVPGLPAVLRHLAVMHGGPTARSDLSARLRLARASGEALVADTRGLLQQRGSRTLLVTCPGSGAVPSTDTLDVPLPTLQPGETAEVTCLLAFGSAGDDLSRDALLDGLVTRDAASVLAESREGTGAFLDAAVALEPPDPAVQDLYEGMLVTHRVQTTPDGLVSPMSRYTKGWLRDAEGTVRLYLRAGLHEQAREVLDTTYRILAVRGEIANSFPLDVDLSGFAEPEDPIAFWGSVPFMEGRAPAEAPSYPVLLHLGLVRRTGDAAGVDAGRLAFLEACVDRQEASPEGLFPFSGDETFRYPMALVLGAMPEDLGWSSHSSSLFVAACDALAELGSVDPERAARCDAARAAAVGAYRVDTPPVGGRSPSETGFWSPLSQYVSGEPWPAPYEDVSTQPLWTGAAAVDSEIDREDLEALLAFALRPDGVLVSPVSASGGEAPMFTGMVPGYTLGALAATQHAAAETVWDGLDWIATPSGHFEEVHLSSGGVLDLGHAPDGLGTDASARYRPWEGGVVVSAMLQWLIGDQPEPAAGRLALAPHLPDGWPWMEASSLRMGDERYRVGTWEYVQGQRVVVTRDASPEGAGTWTLSVTIQAPRRVAAAWVDGLEVPWASRALPGGDAGSQVAEVTGIEVPAGRRVEVLFETP